ncbi:hypothetical protein [Xanthomonas phage JGB6]|nr:hypothetical protein [Xanthomonas phage JGB6]
MKILSYSEWLAVSNLWAGRNAEMQKVLQKQYGEYVAKMREMGAKEE